jgi:hypothetical protein
MVVAVMAVLSICIILQPVIGNIAPTSDDWQAIHGARLHQCRLVCLFTGCSIVADSLLSAVEACKRRRQYRLLVKRINARSDNTSLRVS